MDGYISGADVFIDENFNFAYDVGELNGVTGTDGSFVIETQDQELYLCLLERPIIANVPEGAEDSTTGTVTDAYTMILPSISDAGASTVVVSPFTSLLANTIVEAASTENIRAYSEGCRASDSIADKVSGKIQEITDTIEANFGISYQDLISDYIANSSNSAVNQTKAEKIAQYLPYFKDIYDQTNNELRQKYGSDAALRLAIADETVETVLGNDVFDELNLNFRTRFESEPNIAGWFVQETISSEGAKLSSDGLLTHALCLTDESNCTSSDFTLNEIANASEAFLRSSSYRNEDLFTSGSGDYEVRADFQVRWRENISDGFEKECVSEESINVYTDEEVEDHYLFRRYVVTQFNNGVDKCADFTGQDYTILVRIPDRYTGNEEYTYTYQASYQNSNYDNAGFIINKVKTLMKIEK